MGGKWIGLLTVFGAVALALAVSSFDQGHLGRYHQHLSAPGPEAAVSEAGEFCTHLPIVSIDTGGQEIPGEARDGATISASLEVRDNGGGSNRLSDAPTASAGLLLRYRGNTSMHFDKKSFRLKLVEADGESRAMEMLGMPKEDEWILNGPFLDKSLLRNYLCMNLSGEVMDTTPEVRYCELFLDGEYRGVYLMMESVSRSLVGMNKDVKDRSATPYIVRLDRGGAVELNNLTYYTLWVSSRLDVIYPSGKSCTPEQAAFIERDFSQFEKALYSLDYDDPSLGYQSYINVESFVDYLILNEFFQNYDAGLYSTYLYKPLSGKLSMGPVWDFNNALDNYFDVDYDATGFAFPGNVWYSMLCKDERFVDRVIRRYRELRQSVLADDYLQQYVDDVTAFLGPAAERNFAVWGYTFRPEYGLLKPVERNLDSHAAAVAQVKRFLSGRGAWLDENIELLQQYCHPSATKPYQH